jgi:uncharacterized protein (DUF2267 family)
MTIERWLKQLSEDEFAIREQATKQLTEHLAACRERLEQELRQTTSAEVRARLAAILADAARPLTDAQQTEQQIQRILAIIQQRRS